MIGVSVAKGFRLRAKNLVLNLPSFRGMFSIRVYVHTGIHRVRDGAAYGLHSRSPETLNPELTSPNSKVHNLIINDYLYYFGGSLL